MVTLTAPATATAPHVGFSWAKTTAEYGGDYYFDHWNINGVIQGTTNPITVTMTANTTAEAVYNPIRKGDGTGNNYIDIWDFAALIKVYKTTTASPSWNPVFDFDNSGVIDIWDYADFVKVYGT